MGNVPIEQIHGNKNLTAIKELQQIGTQKKTTFDGCSF